MALGHRHPWCCFWLTAPASSAVCGLAFRSSERTWSLSSPGVPRSSGGTKAGNEVRLTIRDLDYIRDEVPLLKAALPRWFKQSTGAGARAGASYGVSGVYAIYPRMRRMESPKECLSAKPRTSPRSCRYYRGRRQEELFSGQNAIGEGIRVDGISYQIVLIQITTVHMV